MLDTLFIGMSGLSGYSRGLKVISNNLTNMNTLGYKAGSLQFSTLFQQGQGGVGGGAGNGISTAATVLNFQPGDHHQTGKPFDLAISGTGYFVVRDGAQTFYTRAGRFEFDADGYLVNENKQRVAALDGDGKLVDLNAAALRSNSPKATAHVKFEGSLVPPAAPQATAAEDTSAKVEPVKVSNVRVVDGAGRPHTIQLAFTYNGSRDWTVSVSDEVGDLNVDEFHLQFDESGKPVGGADKLTFMYGPAEVTPFSVSFDFSAGVQQVAAAGADSKSTIKYLGDDGAVAGAMQSMSIEADGTLKVNYSNGQSANGLRLALAQFSTDSAAQQVGGGLFSAMRPDDVRFGQAGAEGFGAIKSATLEGSNVAMEEEFGNLIVLQRGYQASSHVVSTANEMIAKLFEMDKA